MDDIDSVIDHYKDDADAMRKLETNQHILKKIRNGDGVKRSTLRKILRRHQDIRDRSFDIDGAIKKIK